MLRNVLPRAVLFTLVCVFLGSSANAVPSELTHQGRLLDASDAPISGVFTIVYSIYDAPVGGTQLWFEDHVGVVVTDGLFTVQLGSIVPLNADIVAGPGGGGGGGSARYLQVQLSGQPPIMPRTQLVSSPFSLATERVSGDFHSGPGIVVIGDTTTNSYATFGEKVSGGLQAAGSALSQGGSLLTQDCDDDDAEFMMRHSQGSNVGILHARANIDSLMMSSSFHDAGVETEIGQSSSTSGSSFSMSTIDNTPSRLSMNVTVPKQAPVHFRLGADSDDDGLDESSVSMSSSFTSSRVAIKTRGTGADKNRAITSETGADSVFIRGEVDENGDDDPESSFEQVMTPVRSAVAIKTRGTGADKNRSAGSSTDDTLTIHYADIDDDDDGISEASAVSAVSSVAGGGGGAAAASYARWTVDSDDDGAPEGDISQIVTPTTCGVAINTKGTGAAKGRVALHTSAGGGGLSPEMSMILEHDSDGDTVPESEISHIVTPGTCSVAIKTRGTGADKNRSIGSSCNDSVSITYLDIDDDGDGISEAKAVSSVSTLSGAGGGAAAASYAATGRMYTDSDDDGVPEGDISQIVTPTTCSVAIKTRGTGADKNRTISSDCDDSTAVQIVSTDDDGDGITNGSVKISSGASLLGGALPGGAIISARCDSDDDGVAEQELDQVVTPTTCSVAIKTRGTGADKNRVVGETDDTTASVSMATDSASISMRVRKGGIIKGAININHGSAMRIQLASDGTGYFDSGIGVGVDPTHHIDVVGGAYCDGTNWVNASDRNSKENFEVVDGGEILEKISDLEITKWNYKGDDDAQHIGPTAQDFKKTFGVGADDRSISTIDPSGIALAAIKELYAQLTELQKRDKEQSAKLRQRDAQLEILQIELKKLKDEMKKSK